MKNFRIGVPSVFLVFLIALAPLAKAQDCPLFFEKNNLCASLLWDHPPLARKESPFSLQFWQPSTSSLPSPSFLPQKEDLKIVLWMPDMGHGSSPVRIESLGQGEGKFQVRNVYFSMAGTWQIKIKVTGPRGIEEALWELSLP